MYENRFNASLKRAYNCGFTRRTRVIGHYLWREWIRPLAPLVIVLMTLRGAIADWNDVPSGSMYPTIEIGDRIFVNKLAYGLRIPFTHAWIAEWSGPQRGEIAVLTSPAESKTLVKRVIGLPGDTIEMRNNVLFINGRPLDYSGMKARTSAGLAPRGMVFQHIEALEALDSHPHPVLATPSLQAQRTFGPLRVPEDCYFVMGDNRDMSADSRAVGFVPRHLLIGRSTHVVLSFDPDNWYLPRLDRIWTPLPQHVGRSENHGFTLSATARTNIPPFAQATHGKHWSLPPSRMHILIVSSPNSSYTASMRPATSRGGEEHAYLEATECDG